MFLLFLNGSHCVADNLSLGLTLQQVFAMLA
uniref:Uncharacterized protein n=1 Tax=Anguilla anguilla TaxID=7936 RepID=A0A0E9U3T2_ANGAN